MAQSHFCCSLNAVNCSQLFNVCRSANLNPVVHHDIVHSTDVLQNFTVIPVLMSVFSVSHCTFVSQLSKAVLPRTD